MMVHHKVNQTKGTASCHCRVSKELITGRGAYICWACDRTEKAFTVPGPDFKIGEGGGGVLACSQKIFSALRAQFGLKIRAGRGRSPRALP